jgi:hypothetical protein
MWKGSRFWTFLGDEVLSFFEGKTMHAAEIGKDDGGGAA